MRINSKRQPKNKRKKKKKHRKRENCSMFFKEDRRVLEWEQRKTRDPINYFPKYDSMPFSGVFV